MTFGAAIDSGKFAPANVGLIMNDGTWHRPFCLQLTSVSFFFQQLSVVNKGMLSEQRSVKGRKVWNFHFKVKENGADFFYPGSRH